MFVIGRNVEVKVEDDQVIIKCKIENVVPTVREFDKSLVFATTKGGVVVPGTRLRLDLNLYRLKTE
ncbi:unnamed protein product [marine sediment metagenome]|uniref:Uncharacterized protein n=1 Tax=marine sediment metagenome TaxID=412755 RepID=X1SAQ6_9ZZZZ